MVQKPNNNRLLFLVFAFLFFLAGFTSLVYQVAWQRVLTQVIGIDAYSLTLIIAIFMAGLGFGGLFGSRIVSAQMNAPLLLALLQLFMGVFGILSVPVIKEYNGIIGNAFGFSFVIFMNFLLLFLPTLLMGITTPLMVHVFRNSYSAGRAASWAYSVNVLGAATGALISGMVMIGTLGLTKTCQLTGGLDILIGLSLYLLSQKAYTAKSKSTVVTLVEATRSLLYEAFFDQTSKATHLLILSSFIVGFVALAYEIAYFRLFTSYFGVTPYVFPILLFAYLMNMSLGVFLVGRLLKRFREEPLFFIFAVFALIFTLPIQYLQEFFLKVGYFQPLLVLDSSLTIFEYNLPHIVKALVLSLILMTPIAFISGIFPLFVNILPKDPRDAAKAFGRMYFFQTLGNMLGCLFTGFVLYFFIGTIQILKILGIALAISGILFGFYRGFLWSRSQFSYVILVLLIMIVIPTFVYNENYYDSIRYFRTQKESVPPEIVIDNLHGMTLVYDEDGKQQSYTIEAGGRFHITSFLGKQVDRLLNVTLTSGGVDILYGFNPEVSNCLYIGLGTASEVLAFNKLFPEISIDLVEINPDVVTIVIQNGLPDIVRSIHKSNVYTMDGRRFVTHYSKKKYDSVHIGVHRATTSGAGNLFSLEFLKLIKDVLTDRGMVSFYSYPPAVKAALEVFPEVVLIQPKSSLPLVVAFKKASFFHENWPVRFAKNHMQAIKILAANDGKVPIKSPFAQPRAFVLRTQQLRQILRQVSTATDDLLVSEYYLNQKAEIRPCIWINDRPRDFRMFEPVSGAEIFPHNGRIQRLTLQGKKVYAWSQKDENNAPSSPIQHSGGSENAYKMTMTKKGISIDVQHKLFYQERLYGAAGWQWYVKYKAAPAPSEKFFTLEVVAEKKGRGQWGTKIYYRDQKKERYKVTDIATAARGKERLFVTSPVPADAREIYFAITFDDSRGFGSKSKLTIQEINIYEHKDEYWRPTPDM